MARTVVAITGASSGIGEVFARKLAPEHDLILIARREDRLQGLARELRSAFGAHVETIVADLTRDDDIARVAQALAAEQQLVLLVNNAGFGSKGRFWQASLASQEQMHKLHVMATMRLTHAALQNMVPRDVGGIINVASVSAFVRTPGTVSYSATKAWMNAFTEGIYLELQGLGSNVVVQTLCPGFTYSEFHDTMGLARMGLAARNFWMTAEFVVEQSLDGLRKRKLFVIPGWRYRLITALFSKVPTPLRLSIEAMAGRARKLHLNGR